MSDATITLKEAARLAYRSSDGQHIGKVMKEGGCVMFDGKMKFFTPAPPWVFRAMAAGVQVDFGAWCRSATAEAQELMDKLLAEAMGEQPEPPPVASC